MKKLNQKGFTLIEMMIVLIVVSILTLLIIPNAASYITKANEEGCAAYKASVAAQNTANSLIGITGDVTDSATMIRLCGTNN